MDKILLETSFYWLSDDKVRFKIDVGFFEKKCNSKHTQNGHSTAHTPYFDDVIIMATIG